MNEKETQAALETIGDAHPRTVGVSRVHGGVMAYAPAGICSLADIKAHMINQGHEVTSEGIADGRVILLVDSTDVATIGRIVQEVCEGPIRELVEREGVELLASSGLSLEVGADQSE